jgi:hypothetical protein
MLRIGKFNNFVAWLELLKADAGALYDSTARFLTYSARYIPRIPIEAENNPVLPTIVGQPAPPVLTASTDDRRNKSIKQQLKDEEKLINYVK